jgi:hypothetical protein
MGTLGAASVTGNAPYGNGNRQSRYLIVSEIREL